VVALPTVSVVIPARNAAGTLADQLGALAAQTTAVPFEVLVVNNASTDRTHEVVEEWRKRIPSLREVSEPLVGVNHARNAGITATTSDLILFCDADDVVDEGWVDAMVAALAEREIMGGRLEYERLNAPNALRGTTGRVASKGLMGAYGRIWASTANLGVRRSAVVALGGFDRELELGCEDMDFGLRAADAGYKIGFAPDAVVHYRLRSELGPLLRQKFAMGVGGAHLYAKYRAGGRLDEYSPRIRRNQTVHDLWHVVTRSPRLLSRRSRWAYLGQVAKGAGRIVGWWRYSRRHLVDSSRSFQRLHSA
jgi:glycosyltransferase involved in cell wall biosynthesis